MHALVVSVAHVDLELAADHLWALGVVAVEEREDAASGTVELWTSLGEDTAAVASALADLPWPWRFEDVDEAVSETWRLHAVPTWVADDVVVYPAWHEQDDFRGATAIAIEPGATFGMGDHPTTVVSLRALRAAVAQDSRVLDVGCGSGVLAVAACIFGARHVDAIDISPAAIAMTRLNAERNDVTERIAVSTTPIASIEGSYDVVVANILAPALIAMADDLRRVLAPAGSLIISGILTGRHQHVLDALLPLSQTVREDLDGWTAITLRR